MHAAMTYRVVQWTTGNVGARSVRAVVANPSLELVGCFAWGADKVGQDVGALVGIDDLAASCPDSFVHNSTRVATGSGTASVREAAMERKRATLVQLCTGT